MAKRIETSHNAWIKQNAVHVNREVSVPVEQDSIILSGLVFPDTSKAIITDNLIGSDGKEPAVVKALSQLYQVYHTGSKVGYPDIVVKIGDYYYGVETKRSATAEGTISANYCTTGMVKPHCSNMLACFIRQNVCRMVAFGQADGTKRTIRIAQWDRWEA